ncbi:MAG TPA: hypothetical protein VIX81_06075 [Gammaproteobacteria bacterium]
MRTLLFTGLLLYSVASTAQDWPQACYNEVSMWVTNACKTYIQEVYRPAQETTTRAAPMPVLGSGRGGLLLLATSLWLLIAHRRRRAAGAPDGSREDAEAQQQRRPGA